MSELYIDIEFASLYNVGWTMKILSCHDAICQRLLSGILLT